MNARAARRSRGRNLLSVTPCPSHLSKTGITNEGPSKRSELPAAMTEQRQSGRVGLATASSMGLN